METKSDRRSFFARLAAAFAFVSVGPAKAASKTTDSLDLWFDKIKGDHKIVFDSPSVNDGVQTIWTWAFLDSHNHTGTPDNKVTAMVVFRHMGIGLALQDSVWKKYNLGKLYSVNDPVSHTPSTRNPYWDPQPGEMPEEGMAIKKLQSRGVLFCVCEKAIANTSRMIARSKNLEAADVQKDLIAGLLPDIQIVPSGVWALQKAQQRGCAYCFAG
jgi:intracellular sulfur oxidation DsrE/DsrF family protein